MIPTAIFLGVLKIMSTVLGFCGKLFLSVLAKITPVILADLGALVAELFTLAKTEFMALTTSLETSAETRLGSAAETVRNAIAAKWTALTTEQKTSIVVSPIVLLTIVITIIHFVN